jgi:hypothetical protein
MFRHRFLAWLILLAVLLTPALAHSTTGARAATPSSPAAVIAWNAIAQRTAITVARQAQTQSMIHIAFAQAAVYDAVVAIEGGYQPYQVGLAHLPEASVDAAVATAAYYVLVHYFPDQQAALDTDYTAALEAIPGGVVKETGIDVGRAAATGLIALRRGDGLNADIGFTMPPAAPGVWQLPAGQSPQTPWVSRLRPFMLARPDQFRPEAPPELTSKAWARDFHEVKTLGRSDGSSRTAEQTDIARFWSTNAVVQYNTAFAQLTQARGLSAVESARLFAMGNLIGADALIACFDAKYHYLFWRPQFAIPQGDTDPNPDTIGDPSWTPLLATPNHPEYPAAHGCLTAAEAEVFARFFDTKRIEVDLTSTVTQTTRHYQHTGDLVHEMGNARVWGGVHYRQSVEAGVDVGQQVARWALKRFFRPES